MRVPTWLKLGLFVPFYCSLDAFDLTMRIRKKRVEDKDHNQRLFLRLSGDVIRWCTIANDQFHLARRIQF